MVSDTSVGTSGWTGHDAALEREYSLRPRHPERSEVYARQAQASAQLRARAPGLRTLRYAQAGECLLDYLPAPSAAGAGAPAFVFIHGGYWRALERGNFTFLAQPWLERGVHAVFPGYGLAPALRVSDIAGQIAQAMEFVRHHAAELGIDTTRIVVAGHSAGAQLGALALEGPAGWHAQGFVGVSGIYDLEPLLRTSINDDIRLDAAEARRMSPRWQPIRRPTRHLLAAGGGETDGFRHQTIDFAGHLQGQGCSAQTMIVGQCTHFNILDELGHPDSALFRAAHALLDAPRP